jgi:hypothetical protein
MPFLVLAAALCAAPAAAAERRYSVTDFDRVQVDGPYEVVLTTGGTSQASASGDAAALERVSVDVQGRTLRVRPNRTASGGNLAAARGPVRITLSTRDIRAATVIGPGSLAIDRARGLRLDLSVSGSGRLSVGSVAADTLGVGLIGSGTISLAGTAKQLRASAEGSGNIDARGLKAEDADLVAGTSGEIAFQAGRTAKVRAHGRGLVQIGGTPACTVSGLAADLVRCGK